MAYFKKVPASGHEGKIVYGGGIVDNIILLAVSEVEGVKPFIFDGDRADGKKAVKIKYEKDGIHVDVAVRVHYTRRVSDMAFKIQESVKHNVEAMTEYHIAEVSVNVMDVIFDDEMKLS